MSSLPGFLACPACGSDQLKAAADHWQCSECHKTHSKHGNILSFFADEDLARIQWQSKFLRFKSQTEQKIQKAESAARQTEILDPTRRRLENYAAGLKAQLQELEAMMTRFGFNADQKAGLAQLLSQRIPSTQHILSYFTNIFRDWAWTTEENDLALKYVSAVWPSSTSQPLVVLGPGPSRLAFDLAEKFKIGELALMEINPIQLQVAAAMGGGEAMELTELCEFPASLDSVAKKWRLPARAKTSAKVSYLWTDAINLPLKKNAEICILTPWFIDIIPEDFASFARRLNNRLAKNCYWINFGPLGFGGPEKTRTYTQEEIKALLAESGFEIEAWEERQLPYLNSPLSTQSRAEKVFLWRARKVRGVKEPPRFQYYPSWLTNLDEPIPRSPEFQTLALKSQFEAQILSSVDGKLNLRQFAELLAKHSNLAKANAEELLLTFFSNWYEDISR